jgi:hypothetical protein
MRMKVSAVFASGCQMVPVLSATAPERSIEKPLGSAVALARAGLLAGVATLAGGPASGACV